MSPHEHEARERKAARIADHVWNCFLFACGDTNPTHAQVSALVTELAASGEAVRAAFARGAAVKPPSSRTWLRVIELTSSRGLRVCREAVQSDARLQARATAVFTAAEPNDAFAGLTEADDAVMGAAI